MKKKNVPELSYEQFLGLLQDSLSAHVAALPECVSALHYAYLVHGLPSFVTEIFMDNPGPGIAEGLGYITFRRLVLAQPNLMPWVLNAATPEGLVALYDLNREFVNDETEEVAVAEKFLAEVVVNLPDQVGKLFSRVVGFFKVDAAKAFGGIDTNAFNAEVETVPNFIVDWICARGPEFARLMLRMPRRNFKVLVAIAKTYPRLLNEWKATQVDYDMRKFVSDRKKEKGKLNSLDLLLVVANAPQVFRALVEQTSACSPVQLLLDIHALNHVPLPSEVLEKASLMGMRLHSHLTPGPNSP